MDLPQEIWDKINDHIYYLPKCPVVYTRNPQEEDLIEYYYKDPQLPLVGFSSANKKMREGALASFRRNRLVEVVVKGPYTTYPSRVVPIFTNSATKMFSASRCPGAIVAKLYVTVDSVDEEVCHEEDRSLVPLDMIEAWMVYLALIQATWPPPHTPGYRKPLIRSTDAPDLIKYRVKCIVEAVSKDQTGQKCQRIIEAALKYLTYGDNTILLADSASSSSISWLSPETLSSKEWITWAVKLNHHFVNRSIQLQYCRQYCRPGYDNENELFYDLAISVFFFVEGVASLGKAIVQEHAHQIYPVAAVAALNANQMYLAHQESTSFYSLNIGSEPECGSEICTCSFMTSLGVQNVQRLISGEDRNVPTGVNKHVWRQLLHILVINHVLDGDLTTDMLEGCVTSLRLIQDDAEGEGTEGPAGLAEDIVELEEKAAIIQSPTRLAKWRAEDPKQKNDVSHLKSELSVCEDFRRECLLLTGFDLAGNQHLIEPNHHQPRELEHEDFTISQEWRAAFKVGQHK